MSGPLLRVAHPLPEAFEEMLYTQPMSAADYDNISAWDDGRWNSLATLTENITADICVIGLGGSGLTALQVLSDANTNAVGIDARSLAAGAAGRNGGLLLAGTARFHHQTVAALGTHRAKQLYGLTLAEIDRIHASMPEAVSRSGSLRIAGSLEELQDCEQQFQLMDEHGLPVARYAGPEGTGLLFPRDAAFNPLQRCRALGHRLLDRGVRLFEHTRAIKLSPGRVVTERGSIDCETIIVAIDGALEQALPELIGKVRTARLQMLATAPTDEITITRPVYARYGYEYWQQTPDRRLVLGGFRDAGGDAEWTDSDAPSQPVQKKLEMFLREHLHVRAPITHHWASPVGYTPNSLPIIKEVRPRIWAVGGYNGTGNVIGALCARAVTQQILTGASEILPLLATEPVNSNGSLP